MPTSEPRRRLQKLFRRNDQSPTPSSPSSPSSPAAKKHVKRSSSHGSLKDWVQGVGKRSSVYSNKRYSTDSPFTPRAQAPGARPPSPNRVLPEVPAQDNLETDFNRLSVYEGLDQRASNEKAADSNAARRQPRKLQVRKPLPDTPEQSLSNSNLNSNDIDPPTRHAHPRPFSTSQPSAAGVATSQPGEAVLGGLQDVPAPLKLSKSRQDPNDWRPTSPTSDVPNRLSSDVIPARKPVPQAAQDSTDEYESASEQLASRSMINGSNETSQTLSQEQPLAKKFVPSRDTFEEPPSAVDDEPGSAVGRERGYQVKDSKTPIDLNGIVNLENTEETHLHERWAPAVTHETIVQNVHEIREEHITREIHNDEVHHRILPIVDIEVLPARHFVPVEGGYAEISEKDIPGRTGSNAQWLIAETVSKFTPKGQESAGPRDFTARKFENGECDSKQYTAPEGHQRTEEWWVHPPTLEAAGRDSGQTYPFHFGSADPADDGLRAKLPPGRVIGSSPSLAGQQRSQRQGDEEVLSQRRAAETQRLQRHGYQEAASQEEAAGSPPPVPPHKSMISVLNRSRPISRDGHRNRDSIVFSP